MKWISVKDRLPDVIGDYLAFDPYFGIAWGFYNSKNKWVNGDEFMHHVTHWMPLPEPPEGADK